nr:MAG TPA: hypothetical protein [Caudoviricetes sp.]
MVAVPLVIKEIKAITCSNLLYVNFHIYSQSAI